MTSLKSPIEERPPVHRQCPSIHLSIYPAIVYPAIFFYNFSSKLFFFSFPVFYPLIPASPIHLTYLAPLGPKSFESVDI